MSEETTRRSDINSVTEERQIRNLEHLPVTSGTPDWAAEAAAGRKITRSSADADNGLDAFVGQSRSTNIWGPFQVK